MKKIIALVGIIFMLTGCGVNTAKNAVELYLKKYRSLDSEVLVDLEKIIDKENLSDIDKDKYREIMKKQYKDLGYEVVEEKYDGDTAYVTVKIMVYDLYKAQKEADEYLNNNQDKFNDENGFNSQKFISYKLDRMKNMTEKINYTITFTVTKENDKYVVVQPTENDLMKIHGIYNYDLD